jgi:HTH-type transcriptional regulator/antitoxin HigA
MTNEMPVHPGEVIGDEIDAAEGVRAQRQIALRMGVSEKHLCQLLAGRVRLSAQMALRVEDALGISAELLMVLQVRYDLALLRAGQSA